MQFRRMPPVFTTLWIIAAGCYWHTAVQLPADRVFELPPGRAFRGFAPNGDAVLVNTVPEGARSDGHTDVGPIEFWRFPELTKVREVFIANDAIDNPHPDALGRIVVVRDGSVWLANLDAGELLEELPGVETKRCQRNLFNDRLIWVRDQTAFVFDLTSKRVLASYSGQLWAIPISGTLWSLGAAVPSTGGGFQSGDQRVFDIETGQLDHRFDHLGPLKSIMSSPDGRVAAIETATTVTVCELSSAKQLWSIPTQKSGRFRFQKDSAALAMDYLDENIVSRTARWRVSDGLVIDPLPSRTGGTVLRRFDHQGRYAIDEKFFKKGLLTYVIDRGVYECRRLLGGKRPAWGDTYRSTMELRDLKMDRPIGAYSFEYSGGLFQPDGSGFVAETEADYEVHRLRYYRLPPRRDWWWLVRWGMAPPLLFLALRWGVSRVQRRQLPNPG